MASPPGLQLIPLTSRPKQVSAVVLWRDVWWREGEMMAFRSRFLLSAILLGFLVMLVRVGILTVGEENARRSNLAIMGRSAASIDRLNAHMAQLNQMTSNIENYNFGQIREALALTTTLVNQLGREFKAQQTSWEKVQAEIRRDQISFLELKNELAQIQDLQANEIVRLKKAIDEAARPSIFADAINLVISFVLGFFSSIAASWAYVRWKGHSDVA